MEQLDVIVIGAGVVGLACARALALRGREVLVLEAADAIGTGISSRNSEVIHAGLYYPPGSLKARHCVAGARMLYGYCADRGIAHRRCGKLVVATSAPQCAALSALQANALSCGVPSLRMLGAAQASALEPELRCEAALLSPDSGIVDSHALMLALQGDLERAGGHCVLRAPVQRMAAAGGGIEVALGGDAPMTVQARTVVNSAGLAAPALAEHTRGFPRALVPPARYAKGNYFALHGRAPFSRLIYPVPEAAGLGVHLTLDLAGQAKFGPDVQWVDTIDYTVDASRAAAFYDSVRRYWPGLRDGALAPAYAGVRPKLHGPGEPAQDFRILGAADHGVPGLVQLFGIESPGLTAALSIAYQVAALAPP
jgi:L-2-hydroxyglutarate oxidase LhgO